MTQTEGDELNDHQDELEMMEETESAKPDTALIDILTRLDNLEQTVGQLAANFTQLSERTNLIPRQVRQLGGKVDDMTESISQPRVRDLLHSILLLYDLVEQMGRAASTTDDVHNYQVLRDQLLQILRVNGISLIPTDIPFNPALHKAVETIPCDTSEEDNQIVQVYRPGFQTERAILRYAEVVVKRWNNPDGEE